LSTGLSLLANRPFDELSWLRTGQYFFAVFLGLFATNLLINRRGVADASLVLLRIVSTVFWFSLLVLVVFLVIDPSLALSGGTGERGLRLGGSVLHPNTLALGATLALASHVTRFRSVAVTPVHAVAACLAFLTVVVTDSSGGLALAILCSTAFVLSRRNITRKIFLIGMVFAVAITGLSSVLLGLLPVDAYLGGISLPPTWRDRLTLYQVAMSGAIVNPAFGVGPFEGVQEFFRNNSDVGYFIAPHAHNFFLDIFLSRGAVGGLPFLIMAGVGLRLVFGLLRVRDPLVIGVCMFFLLVFLQGLVESSVSGVVKPFAHVPLFCSLLLMEKIMHSRRLSTQSVVRNFANIRDRSAGDHQ
jgi:O-antigen ligase